MALYMLGGLLKLKLICSFYILCPKFAIFCNRHGHSVTNYATVAGMIGVSSTTCMSNEILSFIYLAYIIIVPAYVHVIEPYTTTFL